MILRFKVRSARRIAQHATAQETAPHTTKRTAEPPLVGPKGRRPKRSTRLRNWVVRRPPSGFSMHVRLAESTRSTSSESSYCSKSALVPRDMT